MTLVTTAECKAYCRVQTTAEDAQINIMRLAAIAAVQAFIRRPITAVQRTFVIPRPNTLCSDRLIVPIYPVSDVVDAESDADDIAAPVITDADDETIDEEDYTIDFRIGVITAASGVTFSNYPFTVVATVGMSAHPDYADFIEPVINAAIMDIVADRWNRRNPAAISESEGGGVSTSYGGEGSTYGDKGLPQRIAQMLDPWRMTRAL